jgi:hypothetical protein
MVDFEGLSEIADKFLRLLIRVAVRILAKESCQKLGLKRT